MNAGRVSLPEFPTSATVYVTILSNDQVIPNVESVNDLESFTILPAGLSNERAWYLTTYTNKYFTENVRRGCVRRLMLEAADADNKIKKTLLVCVTMMNPNTKKKEEENMKNTL